MKTRTNRRPLRAHPSRAAGRIYPDPDQPGTMLVQLSCGHTIRLRQAVVNAHYYCPHCPVTQPHTEGATDERTF